MNVRRVFARWVVPLVTAWGLAGLPLPVLSVLPAATGQEGFLQPSPPYSRSRLLREDASLHAIHFSAAVRGAAVGDRGAILVTENGGESWRGRESGVDCRLSDVFWIDDSRVIAVGGGYDRVTRMSRGVILLSEDGGTKWRRTDEGQLPRLRFLRVSADGRQLYAFGDWSPSSGSSTFASSDGGRTWHPHQAPPGVEDPTAVSASQRRRWTETANAPAPIRGRCVVGESQLWGVGDHGVIVRSADAGRTWQTVRGADRRTAVLVVARRAGTAPWPLLGSESLEFGQRISLLIAEAEHSDPTLGDPVDLAAQGVVHLGGGGADLLTSGGAAPTGSTGASVAEDGTLSPATAESIRAWLAMHRPAMVLLDHELGPTLFESIRNEAIAGGVQRVASYQLSGSGEAMLHRDALLPKTGVLARDLWQDALTLVDPQAVTSESISIRREYDAGQSSRQGDSLTAGLALEAGRRRAATIEGASRRQLQIAQARLDERGRIARLMTELPEPEPFSQSLESLVAQTAFEDRFRLLWSTVQIARSRNLPALELASLRLLAAAGSTASAWADLRQRSMVNSTEHTRLLAILRPSFAKTQGAAAIPEPVVVSPFQQPSTHLETSSIAQASMTTPLLVPRPEPMRFGGVAPPSAEPSADIDLGWESHPVSLLIRDLERQRRDTGMLKPAEPLSADLIRVAKSPGSQGWRPLLLDESEQAYLSAKAITPPRLDDDPSDRCWSGPAALLPSGRSSSDAPAPIELRLVHDAEYIYLLVSVPRRALNSGSETVDPQDSARDQPLEAVDRLQIRIDPDRDLMTSYSLEVSATGRTRDSVDGYTAWQPTWYVAPSVQRDRQVWELAILRRDLVDLPLSHGQSWFVSARILSAGTPTSPDVMPRASEWARIVFQGTRAAE